MKTQETNSSSQKVNNQNGTKMKANKMNNINLPNHTTQELNCTWNFQRADDTKIRALELFSVISSLKASTLSNICHILPESKRPCAPADRGERTVHRYGLVVCIGEPKEYRLNVREKIATFHLKKTFMAILEAESLYYTLN